ncbi:hypothetical protein CBI38_22410 [Rhodococcus oxybenzonivorans]|uniref:Alpha/beta hydrolase fold-3 domain-containing protein n=1 Tax=Rhodococcus oxybenzonivorans TaxID=1990687 RepID=A0A2S2BZ91_9NOCA|nr:alpha/beta hydrolase [Rhodococcus oxybenzonivorans]AWK73903.1 hypothetical protein CBI38_22410 [Rhodococcus oxybenzonivorans]
MHRKCRRTISSVCDSTAIADIGEEFVVTTIGQLELRGASRPSANNQESTRPERSTADRRFDGGAQPSYSVPAIYGSPQLPVAFEHESQTSVLQRPSDLSHHAGDDVWSGAEASYSPIPLENSVGIWIEASGTSPERVLLYLHVGALQCWGLHSHQRLVARMSATLEAAVFMVDYRTVPEYTVSEGIGDGISAFRSLLGAGYQPDQIVLAVDSADGDLALMVPMAIQELGLPLPASIVTISPLTEEPRSACTRQQANFSPCALLPSSKVGVS